MSSSVSAARPFKCASCNKAFTRQENLKRHDQTHHKSYNTRNFACGLCNARFARSDLRKRHVENCHQSSARTVQNPQMQPQQPLASADSPIDWLKDLMAHPPPPIVPSMSNSHISPAENINSEQDGDQLPSDLHCIESFFTNFHRNFPVLHEASFDAIKAPAPLSRAVICIGALCCTSGHDELARKALFDSATKSTYKYVEQNRSRYQETWVLQTFLLLEFFGIYGGDDELFLKAQRIHRDLVDAIRMLQMSHDGRSNRDFQDSEDETEDEDIDTRRNIPNDPECLRRDWLDFINVEARKRSVYCLYFLDSQLAIMCNVRPIISSLEIKYDLPCCENLWLAGSMEEWAICKKEQFSSFNEAEDHVYDIETTLSQGSLYNSTQELLHSDRQKKRPRRLRLLWASPFAAVILVIQLQMMARELIHASCLLERPKAQRRNLSLLTDKQQAQISQALKGIAELVPRNKRSLSNYADWQVSTLKTLHDKTPLWHSFWVMWYYTSISLSHPDSLLVSGIVESNLPLAIATAGYLATPRSKDKRDIYEDRDVFRILNDLELALEELSPQKLPHSPAIESPFVTLLAFKICLVGWRLVRLTLTDAEEVGKRISEGAARSNPSKFVLDAILACTESGEDALMFNGRRLKDSEVRFLSWVVDVFKTRNMWPVGSWIATVMEESVARARLAMRDESEI